MTTCIILFLSVDGEESQLATLKEREYWSILGLLISCSHTGDRNTDHICMHVYMYMSIIHLLSRSSFRFIKKLEHSWKALVHDGVRDHSLCVTCVHICSTFYNNNKRMKTPIVPFVLYVVIII